jgi:hypothetical protein
VLLISQLYAAEIEALEFSTTTRLELAGVAASGFGLVLGGLNLQLLMPYNDQPVGSSLMGATGLLLSSTGPLFLWAAGNSIGDTSQPLRLTALGAWAGGLGLGLVGTVRGFNSYQDGPYLQLGAAGLMAVASTLLVVDVERVRVPKVMLVPFTEQQATIQHTGLALQGWF